MDWDWIGVNWISWIGLNLDWISRIGFLDWIRLHQEEKMDWIGIGSELIGFHGLDWTGNWIGLNLDWISRIGFLDWIGLDCIRKRKWIGLDLDWIGLDWICIKLVKMTSCWLNWIVIGNELELIESPSTLIEGEKKRN